MRFDKSFQLEKVLDAYSKSPFVDYVEPIGIHPVYASYPNDYYFGPEGHPTFPYYQWYHDISSDHDMDSPEGWDFEKGDSTLILVILDTGVRYFHKDLGGPDASYANPENSIHGNIWINWAKYNGTPDYDDDDNGYVDDWVGWDWVIVSPTFACAGEDYTGEDNDPRDFNGHGTHLAGLVSAITNNARGVAGFAGGWGDGTTSSYGNGVKIMCLRIGWSECHPLYGEIGYVRMDFAASALYYAANNGAKIVNASWGSSNTGGLEAAVDYFLSKGGFIAHAAGNSNADNPDYLATRTEVLTVAATDSFDVKASWSNYGTWVDVSAPGVGIISLYHNHDDPEYDYVAIMSGTSMSSPLAAGLTALIWCQNSSWTRQQVFDRIVNTTDNIDKFNPGYEGLLGSGRINTYNALYNIPDTIPPAAVTDLVAATGSGNGEVDLTWTAPGDDGNQGQASTYDIRYVPYANGPIDTEAEWNGATQVEGEPTPGPAGTPESFTVTGLTPGASYYFALKTADEVPNWSGLSNSPWAEAGEVQVVKDYANQDIPVSGTVYNDYTYTHASDNSYEYIEEVENKGNPAKRKSLLEHKWTFDVTGGITVSFKVEAYHTANTENDHFEFSYSTDDLTYDSLLTVTKTSDDNTLQSASLPSSVKGTVYIKVVDTDRTKGNSSLDRVYIDEMFIESSTIPDTIPPEVTVTSPNGGESWYAGTVHKITWDASDNVGISSTDIDYTYDGGANWYDVADLPGNPGEYDWAVPNTPSNQCLVRVTCVDGASNSGSDVSDNYFTILESVETPVFVESIGMRLKSAGPNVTAYATPKVVEDATGYPPLEGVTVYGHWYGATSDVDQCITGSDGTCEVASDKVKSPTQDFCFQVDSLKKGSYYWDSSKGVTYNCITPGAGKHTGPPFEFSTQNYPNPFNPTTEFFISLPQDTHVSFVIYNVMGQKVKTLVDDYMSAGTHTIRWDGTNEYGSAVSSGIYFYRVVAGDNVVTKKMMLVK